MKGMKKCLVAGLISSILATTLTGCGDDAPTLTQEQQFQLEMAKVNANKEIRVAQELNRPDTIVYQDDTPNQIVSVVPAPVVYQGQYNEDADDEYYEEDHYEPQTSYSQPVQSVDTGVSSDIPEPVQSGHSTGDVLLGAAAGALAGYTAGALLNSGHREYTDSNGSKFYIDSKGSKLSESEYEEYKRKNPTLTKARDVATKGQSKVGATVQKAKGKVSDTYKRVANSNTVQTAKGKVQQGREKFSNSKVGQTIQQKTKAAKKKAKKAAQVIQQKAKKKGKNKR